MPEGTTLPEKVTSGGSRLQSLLQQFNEAVPSICVERALAFTRSHKDTEGQDLILRRARSFRATCENIPVTIFEHELIVGTPGAMQRPGPVCPEISWKWLKDELDTIGSRSGDPYGVTEQQKKSLREEVFPYWR